MRHNIGVVRKLDRKVDTKSEIWQIWLLTFVLKKKILKITTKNIYYFCFSLRFVDFDKFIKPETLFFGISTVNQLYVSYYAPSFTLHLFGTSYMAKDCTFAIVAIFFSVIKSGYLKFEQQIFLRSLL